MATKINDIKSVNWQLSTKMIGQVSDGIQDIRQCIGLILTTTKGSDPLRPLFGSDIWRFVDTPVTNATANISAEIINSLSIWEKRINIVKLIYNVVKSRIDFEITATMVESGETTQILFYIDRQNTITQDVIGRAFSNGFNFGFS
jgi:phage baseplate assembly protein W